MLSATLLTLLTLALPLEEQSSRIPSRELGTHTAPVTQIAASPDGRYVVSLSSLELQCSDVIKGKPVWDEELRSEVRAIAANDEYVARHFGYPTVSFKKIRTGDSKRNMTVRTRRLAIDSRTLVLDARTRWAWMGSDEGVVWRMEPSNVASTKTFILVNGGVTCMAMDARSKILAVGGVDGSVCFIDTKREEFAGTSVKVPGGPVGGIAVESRGRFVVAGSSSGHLGIWDPKDSSPVQTLATEGPGVVAIAIDSRGERLAVGDPLGHVRIFEVETGSILETLESPYEASVTGLAFMNKGKSLVVSYDHPKLVLWDLPKR